MISHHRFFLLGIISLCYVVRVPALIINSFSFTGNMQNFTVPLWVNSLDIDMAGAAGGSGSAVPANNKPGLGARVVVTITVTPGSVLHILVGGDGTDSLPSYDNDNSRYNAEAITEVDKPLALLPPVEVHLIFV